MDVWPELTSPVTVGSSCGSCSGYGCGLGVAIGSSGGSSRIPSLRKHTHTHTTEFSYMSLGCRTPGLRCVDDGEGTCGVEMQYTEQYFYL